MQRTNIITLSMGKHTVLIAVVVSLWASLLAHSKEFDQNTALKLTQAGKILSLSDVVDHLHQQERLRDLKLLEATLQTGKSHPVYLLELMDDDHNVEDMCVDALTVTPLRLDACHVAKDRPEFDYTDNCHHASATCRGQRSSSR